MNEIERRIANHIVKYVSFTIQRLEIVKSQYEKDASQASELGYEIQHQIYQDKVASTQYEIDRLNWLVSGDNRSFCGLCSKIANELV